MYGSTVRVYDAKSNVWWAEWFDPTKPYRASLVGRFVNGDIIQVGFWDDRPQRWRFTHITETSFTWEAHYLEDDGEKWHLYTRFVLNRVT